MTVKAVKSRKKGIPKELIYEMRFGSPVYYRDYDKVLSGEKELEEVMGSSGLQAYLLILIASYLREKLDKNKYLVLGGEVGYKFAPRSWYNLDIAILRRDKLLKLTDRYLCVAPETVIEIDTKADLRKFEDPQTYFHRKTQDLLDSGVNRVIWIFTRDRKVWFAKKGNPWLIVNWNQELEVLSGIKLNILELLRKEGMEINEE
jgi:hypothetical protein